VSILKKNTIRAIALVLGLSLFSFVGCKTDNTDPNTPNQENNNQIQNNENVDMNGDNM